MWEAPQAVPVNVAAAQSYSKIACFARIVDFFDFFSEAYILKIWGVMLVEPGGD